jgi:hypothetical protein
MFENGHRQMPEQAAIIPIPEAAMSRGDESQPGFISRGLVRATAFVALIGAAGGVTSGCTSDEKPKAEPLKPHVSAASTYVDRATGVYEFAQLLEGNSTSKASPTDLIPRVSGSNPAIKSQMQKALDAEQVGKLLSEADDAATSDTPFGGKAVSFSPVTDPALRQAGITSVYVFGADKVVDAVDVDDPEAIAKARQDIEANAPEGAGKECGNALDQIDRKYAEDITSGIESADAADEAAKRKQLSGIKDPKIRATAQRVIDLEDASDALQTLGYDGITAAEAREDLANIADDAIRAKALRAVSAKQSGDEYAPDKAHYDFSDQSRDVAEGISTTDSPQANDVTKAHEFRNGLETVTNLAVRQADVELGKEFAASSKLSPDAAEIPAPFTNRDETLDLTNIPFKQLIKNSAKSLETDYEKRQKMKDTYQQFGEVYVKDGQIVFDLQEGLNPKLAGQIKTAYEQVLPFIEAGFASGEVSTIRLIVDDEFDPFYSFATREAYLQLSNDKSITMDRFIATWKHELMHGITRNAFSEVGVTQAERVSFATACNNIKTTAYEDFAVNLEYDDDKTLEKLRAEAQSAHKPIIDGFIKAVKDGTLAEVLKEKPSSLQYNTMGSFNECEEAGLVYGVFKRMQRETGVVATDEELGYLFKSAPYLEFAKTWKSQIDYISVFNDINESTFITEADTGRSDMGHSEDNGTEMCASILDAALTWPKEFRETLKKQSDEDRKAVLGMLGACTEQMAKHPSLQPYVIKLRTEYKLAA